MLAAIYEAERSVAAREVEEVAPGPGGVLVAVARAGICGSDLHHYFGRWKLPERAPGHEFSGTILAVGEGVTDWQVGDRVTAECFGHCGACMSCQRGAYNHCVNICYGSGSGHGGMSERATAPASALFSIDGLTDEQGALVEPLAVGLRAAARLGDIEGRDVAVIGAGNIGLTSALSAKALGARRVVVFARYPHQADMALRLGMDEARLDAPSGNEAYPCVIDSVSTKETLEMSMALVDLFGAIVFAGAITEPAELRLDPLMSKEARLTGSHCYSHSSGVSDFGRAIDWMRSGTVNPTPLITHRFPLAQVGEAFRAFADKRASGAVKVMLLPNP